MKLNIPNDKFKVEGLDIERLSKILELTKPRHLYLITDGANMTLTINFQDEQDFHDFKQTLKYFKR